MMLHDPVTFEFELEGPKNLHVPSSTLAALRDRPLPRIASVCGEMRDHVIHSRPRLQVSFTCGIFSKRRDIPAGLRTVDLDEYLEEYRTATGYFEPRCDRISFRPHRMLRCPQDLPLLPGKEGHPEHYASRDWDAVRKWRVWLFAGSGALAAGARTEFEDWVLAKRDEAVAANPEWAEEHQARISPRHPHDEHIIQTGGLDFGSLYRVYQLGRHR